MYRIGICEVKAREILEEGILQYSKKENLKLEMHFWNTAEEMVEDLFNGMELDVLFLGMSCGSMMQILSGKKIREELGELQMRLIYVGCHVRYTKEMIQSMPFDILFYGFTAGEAANVFERAIRSIRKNKTSLEFQFGKTYYSIPFHEILYLSSDLRRIRVKTHQAEYEFNGLLRNVKENLPKEFLVIHKSFIINCKHVVQFTYENVKMTDGTMLSISKVNRSRVKAFLMSGR